MSRRRFLRITAIAGGLSLAGGALATAMSSRGATAHTAIRTLMGTRVHLTVVGADAGAAQACLAGLEVRFAHNPDHASGMASSLRCGLAALPADADAAVVLLADMPWIDGGHVDRLLAAFDPRQPKIVAPVKEGLRGNPILWPRKFFAEMMAVEGDVGAREVLQRHASQVEAVAFDDDAIFADVDTPAALDALHGK